MSKQIEENIIQEDEKIAIKEIITKNLNDDGSYNIYRDIYEIHKDTGEEIQTEHQSYHASGCKNTDYVGSETTTHVHEKKDGSIYTYDQDKDGNKDYEPYL